MDEAFGPILLEIHRKSQCFFKMRPSAVAHNDAWHIESTCLLFRLTNRLRGSQRFRPSPALATLL